MITYEQGLEEKIEYLQTHVEALETEVEDLNCRNDSYEALCIEMFEQMVILKAYCEISGFPEVSIVTRFLTNYTDKLNKHIPEEDGEDDE